MGTFQNFATAVNLAGGWILTYEDPPGTIIDPVEVVNGVSIEYDLRQELIQYSPYAEQGYSALAPRTGLHSVECVPGNTIKLDGTTDIYINQLPTGFTITGLNLKLEFVLPYNYSGSMAGFRLLYDESEFYNTVPEASGEVVTLTVPVTDLPSVAALFSGRWNFQFDCLAHAIVETPFGDVNYVGTQVYVVSFKLTGTYGIASYSWHLSYTGGNIVISSPDLNPDLTTVTEVDFGDIPVTSFVSQVNSELVVPLPVGLVPGPITVTAEIAGVQYVVGYFDFEYYSTLTKTASPSTYSEVGETIAYVYTITNNFTEDLIGPFYILDDKVIVELPYTPVLAPGESVIGHASYLVTQDDIDAKFITNTACAFGLEFISDLISTRVVYAPPSPPEVDIIGSGGYGLGGSADIVLIGNPSGIYTLVVGKTHDTLYTHLDDPTYQDVKIPDPFAKTGFIDGQS